MKRAAPKKQARRTPIRRGVQVVPTAAQKAAAKKAARKTAAKKTPKAPPAAPGYVRVCALKMDRKVTPTETRLEGKLRTAQQRVKALREDLDTARAKADLAYTAKAAAASAAAKLKAARAALNKRGSKR